MTDILVIFNPAARGEKSRRLLRFLESKAGPRVTLAPTKGPDDGRQLAARGVAEGYRRIVAAGGDGTVNEVVNGFGQADVALGILPLGTVNVFAKELGIPGNFHRAWRVIEDGHTRTLDLPVTKSARGDRLFVQLAGVGFDAWAVRAASWELKKKVGPLAYVVAGLKALGREHPVIEVTGDGGAARGVAVLIGNGKFYGGRFRLFPQAKLDDGLLDICVLERVAYLRMLHFGTGILSGAHIRQAGVQYFQTRTLSCRATEPFAFELDGEDAGDGPVDFSMPAGRLRVAVPA